MDFSPWNWATHFRLHEAACLIAGVMPVSKREPTSDELPPQVRPILISLGSAYYEWYFQVLKPERPKAMSLKGVLNPDGTLPEFPVPTALAGEIVSRAAIREFISEIGHKSAYDFSPIEQKKPFTPVEAEAGRMMALQLLQPQATTPSPAPVVTETTEQRRARWLDWYGKGERGAVQRVYERELLLNPKADRSFIGKEIDKAKKEKAETKRGGAMFGQLMKDGKRTG